MTSRVNEEAAAMSTRLTKRERERERERERRGRKGRKKVEKRLR
jgi:hypothetical protein